MKHYIVKVPLYVISYSATYIAPCHKRITLLNCYDM